MANAFDKLAEQDAFLATEQPAPTRANYRGTKSQMEYVIVTNDLASLKTQLDAAKAQEKKLRPIVLAELDGQERQIREPRSRRIYTLTPETSESIGQVDPEKTVSHCLANGLESAVKTRSAMNVEPSTFRKLYGEGLIPAELAKITTEDVITVK